MVSKSIMKKKMHDTVKNYWIQGRKMLIRKPLPGLNETVNETNNPHDALKRWRHLTLFPECWSKQTSNLFQHLPGTSFWKNILPRKIYLPITLFPEKVNKTYEHVLIFCRYENFEEFTYSFLEWNYPCLF